MVYLVEFYDRDYLDNLISLLHRKYDGIYFLLCNDEEMRKKEILENFIDKYFHIPCHFIKIDGQNLSKIVVELKDFLNDSDEFDFDVTGGCELLAVGLGMLIKENKYHLNIHKYSVIEDKLLFNAGYNTTSYDCEDKRALIEEVVALNGGKLISEDNYSYGDHRFRTEVLRLWQCLKKFSNEWNRFCSLSCEEINENTFVRKLEKKNDYIYSMRVMRSLNKFEIIKQYEFYKLNEKQYLRYTFTDKKQTTELYFKAGSILETYGALAIYECGCFQDVHNSVQIDLNGIITGLPADPRNEIDIMMLFRHTPVFVSCKNTQVTKEYLYEIKVMSKQYGGKYGVAVVLSTRKAIDPVVQRAKEMEIILIDNLADSSLNELKEKLYQYFPQEIL